MITISHLSVENNRSNPTPPLSPRSTHSENSSSSSSNNNIDTDFDSITSDGTIAASRHHHHHQQEQEQPSKLAANSPNEKARTIVKECNTNCTIGDKDILFGRGISIQRRAPNTRLQNFIDVFRDHYWDSDHSERHRIVRRIIDMLRNDGYSFRTQTQQPQQSHPARTECGEETETDHHNHDEADESSVRDNNNANTTTWVVASPSEVHKKVTYLFLKSPNRNRKRRTSSMDATQKIQAQQHESRRDHRHLQLELQEQQVEALNQAIASAIDASSLAATLRKEEEIQAFHQAISSAIDTSSLTETLRNFPSPESSPMPQNQQHQHQHESNLRSFLLPAFPSPESSPIPQNQHHPHELNLRSFLLPAPAVAPQLYLEAIATDGRSSQTAAPVSTTAIRARQLLRQHFATTPALSSPPASLASMVPMLPETATPEERPLLGGSTNDATNAATTKTRHNALPNDGVLWSKGTQQIRLLESMESSLVPATSYSLFPAVEQNAFGTTTTEREHGNEEPATNRDDQPGPNNDEHSQHEIISNASEESSSRTIGYTQQEVGSLTILRPIVLLPG